MDDIFGGSQNKNDAITQWSHSDKILQLLSLPEKFKKGRYPSQIQKILGKMFDTINQWCKLPEDKLNKYITDIYRVLQQKSVTRKKLLSIIGRTRHMGVIYRPLNAFARGLECWAYTVKDDNHHINMTKPLKNDLNLCEWAMEEAAKVGVSFDFILRPMSLISVTARTDAALKSGGIGGYNFEKYGSWFQVHWDQVTLYNPRDIVWRELAAVFVLVFCNAPRWSQKVIRIDVDNSAVKYMLINMRSKLSRPDLQALINHICKLEIKFKFNIWMEWLSTKDNYTADNLSRYIKNPFHNCGFEPAAYPLNNATQALQFAADLCKEFNPKNDLVWIDDEE